MSSDAFSEFRAAVLARDLNRIRTLAADPAVRARINEPAFDFNSPAIVWAAGTLNEDLIELLIEVGADIDARSSWANGPYSALHHATGGSGPIRKRLAAKLIELGATIDLHSAAGLARFDILERELDADPRRITEPGPDGTTPLHLAANPQVAEFLLDRGAPIDQPCVDHLSTPAMWAVDGRREVSAFLVSRGARPDLWMAAAFNDLDLAGRLIAQDPCAIEVRPGDPELGGGNIYIWRFHGASSPLDVARREGSKQMYQLLFASAPPGMVMLEAALAKDFDELTRLVQAFPPDDLQADRVREVLCHSPRAARILLAAGADPDSMNGSGQTAVHHAAWEGDLELLGVLLDAGASGTLRDLEHHGSPWGWAEFSCKPAAQKYLEERGCMDLYDGISLGRTEVVREWLHQHPEELNGSREGAISPIRTAAFNGHMEIVELLLEAGADPTVRSPAMGLTAADLAEQAGHTAIAEKLRAAESSS